MVTGIAKVTIVLRNLYETRISSRRSRDTRQRYRQGGRLLPEQAWLHPGLGRRGGRYRRHLARAVQNASDQSRLPGRFPHRNIASLRECPSRLGLAQSEQQGGGRRSIPAVEEQRRKDHLRTW